MTEPSRSSRGGPDPVEQAPNPLKTPGSSHCSPLSLMVGWMSWATALVGDKILGFAEEGSVDEGGGLIFGISQS
ncbi:hypothetical protein RHGRI_002687 [Rhododendron griersonianum]|uniref:Uncharacterized protein n=1 Tax=Rhododendron griersonianum TaxID=479676 RepID=A0AAV6LQV1_9ERIC|nr:hypothetical protein RHGRI_002687 [Rhododendron griersonianum]